MIVRRATAEDAPACAAIVRRWLDTSDWMPDGPSEADLTRSMRAAFPLREAYVAEDGAMILGYLSLDPDSDHIRGLYVGTPGRGTGRALVERAKEGRDRLTLNSHMPNTRAHRFYAREGFVTVETDLPGSDGVAEHKMEWRR
ncbi:GNAT family N-acetyltransferase [Jannaschia seohaensis]|uniref:Acetyltransferase (GNAT) domain-containing protein n=1 Tax=Jannaschia seohaensis TaxID=475081 RepID=A0A2Y9ACH0_9RHOB|nr:GNAT family N-acetyltransferase [Jannaschia seohaensis]PWJ21266.1 acetyltransferase (GNAT) family protein [Jannaschia seohaensis]SSA41676.1 Acetyltransferase (GNAT) domain-containing protein [Jannaschia seohaensis]